MKVEKQQNRKLYVGVGEIEILAINPTNSQLCRIMNWEEKEDSEEIEYVKKESPLKIKENGEEKEIYVNQLIIDVWYREISTDIKNKIRFNIFDYFRTNKDGTKYQFINQHGTTSWVDEESSLAEWFTHLKKNSGEKIKKQYRKAYVGEDIFIDFIVKFTNLSPFDIRNNIFVDNMVSFFKGDLKEIKQVIEENSENTLMVCFGVKTTNQENDQGETITKEYQTNFNRIFCNGSDMKFFRIHSKNNFENLNTKTKGLYNLAKFVETITDSENGYKDFYGNSLLEISEYIPEQNPINSQSTIVNEQSSSEDDPW